MSLGGTATMGIPLLLFLTLFILVVVTPVSAWSSLFSRALRNNVKRPVKTAQCTSRTKKWLKGRHVLLTGASSGLGRSLAIQLAACGVSTLVLSGRNVNRLQKVASECQAVNENGKVHVITCDLADLGAVSKLASDALDKAPIIDILINNGGVSSRSRFLDTKHEVDELVMRINFLSGIRLAKSLVPNMVQRKKGSVVWIGGIQGLVGIPHRTSNVASKFAIQGYCQALRGELASSGVSVHVASPGYIRTNSSRNAIMGNGENYGETDETTVKGADPDQVAASILDSVAKGKADFVVASSLSAKAAIWLRLLAPSFLNSMLKKRHEKSLKKKRVQSRSSLYDCICYGPKNE